MGGGDKRRASQVAVAACRVWGKKNCGYRARRFYAAARNSSGELLSERAVAGIQTLNGDKRRKTKTSFARKPAPRGAPRDEAPELVFVISGSSVVVVSDGFCVFRAVD